MNRTSGPDKILDVVEGRCNGQFNRIEDVIPQDEMNQHAEMYKRITGYGLSETNERPAIVPANAKFGE